MAPPYVLVAVTGLAIQSLTPCCKQVAQVPGPVVKTVTHNLALASAVLREYPALQEVQSLTPQKKTVAHVEAAAPKGQLHVVGTEEK